MTIVRVIPADDLLRLLQFRKKILKYAQKAQQMALEKTVSN